MKAPPSRFVRLSPGVARAVLLLAASLVVFGFLAPSSVPAQAASRDEGDLALYLAVADRVDAGEWYYDAAGTELRARGYATSPFLNWRLPTSAWTLRALGDDGAALVLGGLAVAVIVAWALALRAASLDLPHALAGGLLVACAVAIATVDGVAAFHEVWAGLLIALSLALRRWSWVAAVLVGALAVAFRELALAYLVVMLVCALVEHRRKEAVAWGVAIAAFFVGLAVHASVVSQRIVETDTTNAWLALGGWPFVLSTANWNLIVLLAGGALTALFVPLALVGSVSWDDALGTRLGATIAAYLGAFLVLGRADNSYWGIVVAPLLAVSITFAPSGLRTLVRASFPREVG